MHKFLDLVFMEKLVRYYSEIRLTPNVFNIYLGAVEVSVTLQWSKIYGGQNNLSAK